LEAIIDFGDDEELDESVHDEARHRVQHLLEDIAPMIACRVGERLRQGMSVTIVGAPNAGKSSLMNTLAGRRASIVSKEEGTTRDAIEVHMDIAGYAFTLCDTAGLRDTTAHVEAEGIQIALERARSADFVVLMIDCMAHNSLSSPHTRALLRERPDCLIVANKTDLAGDDLDGALAQIHTATGANPIPVSCQTGEGVQALLDRLLTAMKQRYESLGNDNGLFLTHERHRGHLQQCTHHLQAAVDSFHIVDVAAEELRQALMCFGRLTGKVDVEEVLDVLFSDFCIGK